MAGSNKRSRKDNGTKVSAPFGAIEDKLRSLQHDGKLVNALKDLWGCDGDLRVGISAFATRYAAQPQYTMHPREQGEMFKYDWKIDPQEGDFDEGTTLFLKSGNVRLVRRDGNVTDVDTEELRKELSDSSYGLSLSNYSIEGTGCRNQECSDFMCKGEEVFNFTYLRCPIYGRVRLMVVSWVQCFSEDDEPNGGYKTYIAYPVNQKPDSDQR